MTKVFNVSTTKDLRAKLRTNMTEPERRLWQRLRKGQLGLQFRRQFGIGRYIIDFYCPSKRLVIELDGDSHYTQEGLVYDQMRDQYMVSLGIRVLHFTNPQVMQEIDAVVESIRYELAK